MLCPGIPPKVLAVASTLLKNLEHMVKTMDSEEVDVCVTVVLPIITLRDHNWLITDLTTWNVVLLLIANRTDTLLMKRVHENLDVFFTTCPSKGASRICSHVPDTLHVQQFRPGYFLTRAYTTLNRLKGQSHKQSEHQQWPKESGCVGRHGWCT